MAEVTIYTKGYCPYCKAAKTLLDIKKVKYQEFDITHDESALQEMMKKANGAKTVPQVFINGRHIGGSDDLSVLNENGELDRLLAA